MECSISSISYGIHSYTFPLVPIQSQSYWERLDAPEGFTISTDMNLKGNF